MGDFQVEFSESCKTIEYPCTTGKYFPDPCDCKNFLRCVNSEIQKSPCSEGTAWDHNTKGCGFIKDIHFKGICDMTKPWTRCNQTDNINTADLLEDIKVRVCNITADELVYNTPAPQTGGDQGPNTGGIVGGVVAGIIGLLVVILIIIVVLKRRQKKEPCSERKKPVTAKQSVGVDNPEYDNKLGRVDSVYAEIKEDTNNDMDDPAYNPGVTQSSHAGGHLSTPVEDGLSAKKRSPILPPRNPDEAKRSATDIQMAGDVELRATDKPDSRNEDVEYDNRAGRPSYIELLDESRESPDAYDKLKVGDETNTPDVSSDAEGYLMASATSDGGTGTKKPTGNSMDYYVLESNSSTMAT